MSAPPKGCAGWRSRGTGGKQRRRRAEYDTMARMENGSKARGLRWVALGLACLSLAGVAAVFLSAKQRGGHPDSEVAERKTAVLARQFTLAPPRPFDRKEFEADPETYLKAVEPGRCFQTAQPTSPDDVRLTMASSPLTTLSPGGEVSLRVKGAANAPVTFTSFNGGIFKESKLGSATVQADGAGLAVAAFSAGPGIRGDIRIQAGSPLAVGFQTFLVRVSAD